ncbi:MAG: type II toxin-antitoxin system RelE/ParE family toxin [Chloroflexia bacterium]|nr:type II toxin-antitoxin system RelE/ParE family toxin [Chloroflexia bacterium]
MEWDVEYTDQFADWFDGLTEYQQNVIFSTVAFLERQGPGLGRPFVDSIRGSRHSNMKELRVPVDNIRLLFAFDPRRMAILLIGGDKTHRWNVWYREMIPVADELYEEHLESLRKEGLL